ncbi:endonuclease/exonuclease/phosphatase family protein [Psychroflexus sp. CAK57W]|uniref:endonuclease/exonuclease/phosphatase family protein n=1 Tax=Psychroflexus curvus TaxID=2873595 RepID=UPI001CCC5E8E|nr:endonuclease/exonuclease/phosphatase family protein [Psychroflexus curvus]MBZ9626984.1 endonuclease/exonuclease/phosphatase family protein [Psychroflexus curvus]MBZ9786978.1 endonuclease/exonuclease/phosphatase family protein [Psychroflexus curvus]
MYLYCKIAVLSYVAMSYINRLSLVVVFLLLVQCKEATSEDEPIQITFATFNVSMESENYLGRYADGVSSQVLIDELASGKSQHIKNIANIIQTKRPDVILLNEFDYIENPKQGVEQFIDAYLKVPQGEAKAIDYPYYYYSTSNTGLETPFDFNGDGKFEGTANDAYGYGRYPGHYGMVLLSKYPIDKTNIRTFQQFKWKDMPNYLETKTADGDNFYSDEAWDAFRLSSKSHWDVPIKIGDKTVHVLASHPTPPGFDGEEDRNGKRNHDEIRFWKHYIDENRGAYIYDDKGKTAPLGPEAFVIMGDLNASPDEGSAITQGISDLLNHPRVNNGFTPSSKGGKLLSPDNTNGKYHTASWKLRADYVLPSTDLNVVDYGVFWPVEGEALHELMLDREASSDHRLVWVEVKLED